MCRKLCYLISFVLFLGLAVTSTAEAAGDPNLVAYWKMDESWGNIAADVAGHDYDAELGDDRLPGEMGADLITWLPAGGMVNGAVKFGDANHCYITAQDMDEADEPVDPNNWTEGTVATWLKLKDPQPVDRRDGNMRFAHGTGSGGRRRIWFDATGEPFNRQLNVGMGDSLTWKKNITTFALETWHYVALTWDNLPDSNDGTGRVFVDGNSVKYTAPYIEMHHFMSNVVIGNSSTGEQGENDGSQSFCGLLDDVAIWNIAKTEPEIVAIYNTGITQPTFARATEPNPGRGDFDVPICPNTWPDPNLGWEEGEGVILSHDVYFGTDYNDVNDGINGTSMGNQLGTDYDPGALALDGTYYWRIDEVLAGPVTIKGRVWEFTIDDGKATDPDPEDDDEPSGADETAPDANLNWLPGAFADTHEIYLGTDEEEVNLADKLSDEYMGTGAAPCAHDANRVCYDPGGLSMGVTYYWRIDEANSVYGTARGDIWGFKVYEYLTVDDWEPYTGTSNMLETWNLGTNTYALALEQTVEDGADDSNQYMSMVFLLTDIGGGTAPYYAEAWRSVAEPDFTGGGFAKALGVSYRSANISDGGTTTDFGEMYVRLEDADSNTATVTLTDPNMDEEWHEWNIDLADFNSNNPDLDLTNISKIHLGVGDNTDRGWGYVYFDEIRKYAIRCMDEFVDDGDINGDCIVNFEDIEDMGDDWLISDSNSIGFDGVLDPDAFLPPGGWVTDPCRGNSLKFDGHEDTTDDSNDWVDLDDYLLPEFQNRTIMTWVKNDDLNQEQQYRVSIFSSTSYTIGLNIGATGTREGHLEGHVEDCKMMRIWQTGNDDLLDVNSWHHVALVIGNKKADEYVYAELYLDGVMIADNTGFGMGSGSNPDDEIPRHTGSSLPNANIGSHGDGEDRWIQATLDNFRIYDYNMPAADVDAVYQLEKDDSTQSYKDPNLILWYKFDETSGDIAEDSGKDKDEHIYHSMSSPANIIEKPEPKDPYDPDNKDIVNFVDYAALADDWLVERLWPPQP